MHSIPIHRVAGADQPATLLNKVAVITGSSAGIGAEIAIELAKRGAKVVLNYPFASLKQEVEEVGAKIKSEWIAVEADLSTLEGPKALIAAAVEKFGTIDILVNNASRVIMGSLAESTMDQWQSSMDLNARGMFLTTQTALPHLTPPDVGGGARIINMISAAAFQAQHHQSIYGATKAAILAMTRCWALELPPLYGCSVNSVAPGPIMTQGLQKTIKGMEDVLESMFDANTPMPGSYGFPEDVAWAVAFLAEGRSGWINGATINVSGGMVMS